MLVFLIFKQVIILIKLKLKILKDVIYFSKFVLEEVIILFDLYILYCVIKFVINIYCII